jgi:AraC-like DNA-binding protein
MDMAFANVGRASLVKGMWSVSGSAKDAVLPGVVVPDSHVEFVFHLGQPWRMRREGESSWLRQPTAFVYAQSHGALRFEGEGHVSLLAFRLSPVVAASVLGRSTADIWNVPVALSDLVGARADALGEQLAQAPPIQRFQILEKWVEGRLGNWDSSDWSTHRLFDHVMWRAPGKNLEALSKQLGWSTRDLRRVFAQCAGLSPKDVQLAGRHLDACALLRERPDLDVTEIAGRAGFYDHAAFTHSFSKRLGMTPSQFRSESHAFYERRP